MTPVHLIKSQRSNLAGTHPVDRQWFVKVSANILCTSDHAGANGSDSC